MEATDKETFVVKVLYRQNSTWQGTIHWVEGNRDSSFRSEMEAMELIESTNKVRQKPPLFDAEENQE